MSALDQMTGAFLKLRTQAPRIDDEDWSESDTRSKFIDTVLIDCLGWTEADIHRELGEDNKRLDYTLSITSPTVIVEAKRGSEYLSELKTTGMASTTIKRLLGANPTLVEPFTQVVKYCQHWSTPFAVLTNGRSYFVFCGTRTDGVRWQDGRVVAIYNIFDSSFDFSQLYNLLSKQAVRAGYLRTAIMGDLPSPPPRSITSDFASVDLNIGKNPVGLAIEPMLRTVFSDVAKDDSPEVLEHCYVLPGETKLRHEEFEALLLDIPPSYIDESTITVNSKNAARKFQETVKNYLARTDWSQTLLVVGGVGVGKTMFLRRFFLLPASHDLFSDQTVPFFIDFRKPGLDPTKIPELIYERLEQQILELDGKPVPGAKDGATYDFLTEDGLVAVFWQQIQGFQKTQRKLKELDEIAYEKAKLEYLGRLREDRRAFVRGVIKVMRERYHRAISLVLDNADQCDPAYQAAIYVYARTLEDELKCLVIVALREEWYWQFGRSGGPFAAYHDIAFHIPAPRARDVLAKRLDYAILLSSRYDIPATTAVLPGNVVLEAGHLEKYLQSCKEAFFNDDEVTVFFECLANGSVRKGLDIFLEFLRSGHTHVQEYLAAIVQRSTYKIQFHQVFKSIAYGARKHYSSSRSMVPNLFHPVPSRDASSYSYFAKLYTLNHLASFANTPGPMGDGMVVLSDLKAMLTLLGLSDDSQSMLVRQMVNSDLIEADVRQKENEAAWRAMRITSFGLYAIRQLVGKMAYIEAVMLDTPLSDSNVKRQLAVAYHEGAKPSLGIRLQCARMFLELMSGIEVGEQRRVQSAGLSGRCPPMMDLIAKLAEPDLARIADMVEHPGTSVSY
ncbi:MAG: hypothetical protein U0637_07410 [Phycisphaerales bacterium]